MLSFNCKQQDFQGSQLQESVRERSAADQLPIGVSEPWEPTPFVSAVIPSYNYGRFVTQAVDSALSQTYRHMEVIVVDDGSTDDTRDRLKPYEGRIRYIYQKNMGLSAARNTGIRDARGEWIALLDADDIWEPQKTRLQLCAYPGIENIGLIGSPSFQQFRNRRPEKSAVTHLTVQDFLLSSRFGPSGALIRRDCFASVGYFNESLKSVEDRDMWLRLVVRFPAIVVEVPCWTYRVHDGQMSHAAQRMYENYRRVLKDFFKANPNLSRLRNLGLSYLNLDASLCFLDAGERLRSFQFLIRSFCRRPWPLTLSNRSSWLRLKLLGRLVVGEHAFHGLASRCSSSARARAQGARGGTGLES
jgi:glycosyltransferase involved in cell wall biosynthesis